MLAKQLMLVLNFPHTSSCIKQNPSSPLTLVQSRIKILLNHKYQKLEAVNTLQTTIRYSKRLCVVALCAWKTCLSPIAHLGKSEASGATQWQPAAFTAELKVEVIVYRYTITSKSHFESWLIASHHFPEKVSCVSAASHANRIFPMWTEKKPQQNCTFYLAVCCHLCVPWFCGF